MSATATLELESLESNPSPNWNSSLSSSSEDNGSYLVFTKNDKKILLLRSKGPFLMNGSNNKTTAFGQFDLLVSGSQLIGNLDDLNDSIVVLKLPELSYFNSATSIKGEINLYLNSDHSVKINLPSQKINNEMIRGVLTFN